MKNWYKKTIIFVIILIFVSFFWYDSYFINYLLEEQKKIILLINEFFIISCLIYFVIYVFLISFSVPVGFFLSLFSGYLFGFYFGSLISIFGATVGSYVIFNLIKYNFKDIKSYEKKYSFLYEDANFGINNNNYKYLFFLRIFPFVPFWLANLIPPLIGVRDIPFLITTFLGIMPMSFLIVFSGSNLALIEKNDLNDLNIDSLKYFWGFLLFFSFLIVSPFIKRFFLKKK